jgi:two-component system response regulator DesR
VIRVLLVEDHTLMRQGTRALLGLAPDMAVVGEAARGDEALTLARRLRPDVALLDIRLAESSGIEVARTLRWDLPEIRILMLSAYAHETYVRTLFAIGVDGYLLKTASDEELIGAVRAVARGEQVLSAEVTAQLAVRRTSGTVAATELSARERDVLALVGEGESNQGIAERLYLGKRTVDSYLSSAMGKLGARSRTDAVKVAVQRGIIVLEG